MKRYSGRASTEKRPNREASRAREAHNQPDHTNPLFGAYLEDYAREEVWGGCIGLVPCLDVCKDLIFCLSTYILMIITMIWCKGLNERFKNLSIYNIIRWDDGWMERLSRRLMIQCLF